MTQQERFERQRGTRDREERGREGVMERIRNMPGKNVLVLALIATGQLSLYVPRRIEGKGVEKSSEPTPAALLSPEEAQEVLMDADPDTVEVTVDRGENGQRIVVTMPNEEGIQVEADPILFTEVELPGSRTVHVLHTNMEWAGRGYERSSTMREGEQTTLEQQIAQQVALMVTDLEQLGLNPNDVILQATIATKGYASPEGNNTGNRQASQGRAELALEAARRALEQHSIAAEKITGTAQGMGAEGNLGEFVTALEESGTTFRSTSLDGKTAEALTVLKNLHDGTDTDPAHIEAKLKTIDAHRRADIAIRLDHVQIVLRFPPEMQEEAEKLLIAVKEYAKVESPNAKTPLVYEVPSTTKTSTTNPPPPPPEPPVNTKLRRIAYYAKQDGGKHGYAPTHQTALGISSSKGVGVGRGHSRSGFGRSQRKHHTGKR